MKECRYYTKIEEGKDGGKSLKVRCELCPHRCVIPAPDACPCHVRGVTFGVLTVRTMTFRKRCPQM